MAWSKMVGFEVSPVTASSSTYRRRVPVVRSSRVMLSSQMLWPASCSFCVAFTVFPSRGGRGGRRRRIVPGAPWDEPVGLGRPPRVRLVRMDRRDVAEDRVDDAPLRLDGVLAGEERRVAGDGIAEEPLVRRHLLGGLLDGQQLDRRAHHGLAGP